MDTIEVNRPEEVVRKRTITFRSLFLVASICGVFYAAVHWFGMLNAVGLLCLGLVGVLTAWKCKREFKDATYAGVASCAAIAGLLFVLAIFVSQGEHERHAFRQRVDRTMSRINASMAADPRYAAVSTYRSSKAFFVRGRVQTQKDFDALHEVVESHEMPLAIQWNVDVTQPTPAKR